MDIFDKYKNFHVKGIEFIPFQAHVGMAFFFTTILANWWVFVVPAMLVIIAIKEYMDMKTSNKLQYSWFDLGSWAIGAVLAVINIVIRTVM